MTFKEFFNKRDNLPMAGMFKPPTVTGMTVVKDLKDIKNTEFYTSPKAPKPYLPKRPLTPFTLGSQQSLPDRPIEKKPTDFLTRNSDPTKNNVKK